MYFSLRGGVRETGRARVSRTVSSGANAAVVAAAYVYTAHGCTAMCVRAWCIYVCAPVRFGSGCVRACRVRGGYRLRQIIAISLTGRILLVRRGRRRTVLLRAAAPPTAAADRTATRVPPPTSVWPRPRLAARRHGHGQSGAGVSRTAPYRLHGGGGGRSAQ